MGFIPKMARVNNPIFGFSKEDARRLHHMHNDALVVSIWVGDYNTHSVLIDNGSFVDILYYPAFQQMRIKREQLVPTNELLVGFGGMLISPQRGHIACDIGDYPKQITKDVTFLVVDYSSTYNAILGRPTLNSWKIVTSTYHLMIKFPTEYEVREVREDHAAH